MKVSQSFLWSMFFHCPFKLWTTVWENMIKMTFTELWSLLSSFLYLILQRIKWSTIIEIAKMKFKVNFTSLFICVKMKVFLKSSWRKWYSSIMFIKNIEVEACSNVTVFSLKMMNIEIFNCYVLHVILWIDVQIIQLNWLCETCCQMFYDWLKIDLKLIIYIMKIHHIFDCDVSDFEIHFYN